MTYIEDCSTD